MGLGRVELPTRSLGNCCSIHLSYSPGLAIWLILSGFATTGPVIWIEGSRNRSETAEFAGTSHPTAGGYFNV